MLGCWLEGGCENACLRSAACRALIHCTCSLKAHVGHPSNEAYFRHKLLAQPANVSVHTSTLMSSVQSARSWALAHRGLVKVEEPGVHAACCRFESCIPIVHDCYLSPELGAPSHSWWCGWANRACGRWAGLFLIAHPPVPAGGRAAIPNELYTVSFGLIWTDPLNQPWTDPWTQP